MHKLILKVKNILLSGVLGYLRWHENYRYSTQFRSYMKLQNIPNTPVEGEKEYLKKWHRLSRYSDIYSYRFFSRFCGCDPNIVPEGIMHPMIEDVLNPPRFRPYYEDKNLYSQYMGDLNMPTILLRSIGGGIFNESYKYLTINEGLRQIPDSCKRVILKPSIDSNSGRGVMVFERRGNEWHSISSDDVLNENFLRNHYVKNYVLQEVVEQHPYMAQFCKTSFNTLRIATYRSVKDEQVKILGSSMRIGKDGSFVDNTHAGAMAVGINKDNGTLNHYIFTQFGKTETEWNGVNFEKNTFVIPNWDKVIAFAKEVAQRNQRCRLLALDLGLDKNGNPIFIEENIGGFSTKIYMYSGHTPFGEYTDEIIDYCAANPLSHYHLTLM